VATPQKIKDFYRSKAWKKVRAYKRAKQYGVCERCGKAGREVHHKIPLTLRNIDDPEIALGLNNLELLCTSCHNAERSIEAEKRGDIYFDDEGNVHKVGEFFQD